MQLSLPSRERELKLCEIETRIYTDSSLPSRERELKPKLAISREKDEEVAPFTGA